MAVYKLDKAEIRRLFELLDAELAVQNVEGELYLVGGAVMCLALDAREATRDVDAFFRPARLIREAALRVATYAGVPAGWLNDAVKGYLSPRGGYDPYLELPHLRVFVARPEHLLAMKYVAMRLGEEFHDLDDVPLPAALPERLDASGGARDRPALLRGSADPSQNPFRSRGTPPRIGGPVAGAPPAAPALVSCSPAAPAEGRRLPYAAPAAV